MNSEIHVPAAVRTVAYVILVLVAAVEVFAISTAEILFGANALAAVTIVSAVSAAVALVAGAFGVYYRPTGPRSGQE